MGKPTGFMEYQRQTVRDRGAEERVRDFNEFHIELDEDERRAQGARCMDCGVPFCQSSFGCPVDNLIPEWNDLVYQGRWEEAFERLMKTNNFPEYTGRVCPAPCESACVLAINEPAVTIKDNECAIIDRAYDNGLMTPRIPALRTGKGVAVIGSGPAGLAAADQLNQAGHLVTVYERADRIGGLLMYGIPNMKLDKDLVQKRNDLMAAEGITFKPGVWVGRDLEPKELRANFDAVIVATGATKPRDLPVPGRELQGIHFAMEFLTANTRQLLANGAPGQNGSGVGGGGAGGGGAGGNGNGAPHTEAGATAADGVGLAAPISARGRRVLVIGGGDTGNDCIGTAVRHGCSGLKNFELLAKPASSRTAEYPWPVYPRLFKSDYGHTEVETNHGADPREFGIMTKEFLGDEHRRVRAARTVRVRWEKPPGDRPRPVEIPGSEEEWPVDLVLLALGFLGPEQELVDLMRLETDERTNIRAEFGRHATSVPGVFAAGDARRGQSLVVWAIKEGRLAAREVDRYLMGETLLP